MPGWGNTFPSLCESSLFLNFFSFFYVFGELWSFYFTISFTKQNKSLLEINANIQSETDDYWRGKREWVISRGGERMIICSQWKAEGKEEFFYACLTCLILLCLYILALHCLIFSSNYNYLYGNPTLLWPTLYVSLCSTQCDESRQLLLQWWDSQSKWVSDMIKSNHLDRWLGDQQFRFKGFLDDRTWKA